MRATELSPEYPSLLELMQAEPCVASSCATAVVGLDSIETAKARQKSRRDTKQARSVLKKAAEVAVGDGMALPPAWDALPTTAHHFLSVRDLASRWRVGVSTIWRWAKTGAIPAPIALGEGTTRWALEDIEAYEAKRREGGK